MGVCALGLGKPCEGPEIPSPRPCIQQQRDVSQATSRKQVIQTPNTGKAKHKCTYQCRTCVILYQGTKNPDPRTVPISSMRCSACLPSPCNTNLCAAPALLHIIHAACTPESRSATLSCQPHRLHFMQVSLTACYTTQQETTGWASRGQH